INAQLDIIKSDAVINVYPYASITVGQKGEQLSDMDKIGEYAVAFSDDGKGVQSEELMRQAMLKAKKLGKIIVAHCEDNSLLNGGYIHKGIYAEKHNHKGICSESEWKPIERDIRLVKETGCAYHVCHISCKESVELIRQAKKNGVDITCETAPHYLILDENNLQESGNFKMNPPLRSKQDRLALIEGLKDGTIDMIATDHAPHSAEEKSRGLEKSAFGIVGIETAFPLIYTYLVKENVISVEKLIDLLVINPRKRFNINLNNDFSVWNLNKKSKINTKAFLSKGHSTPFENTEVYGECILTVCNGKVVYCK
ncbi:MAG: dihydroorotase, partial [Ruminococcus sp.]|nr:dihydroorotase [Candidatus Copronaster equi]